MNLVLFFMDKQQEVNLLIENKILGKSIARVSWLQGIEKINRGPYFQIRIEEGLNRDIRFCNSPIILIDGKKISEEECYNFINQNINLNKLCVIKDFIFTYQSITPGKDNHYNGISKIKIHVDNQIITIETDNKNNSFTKIM